MIRLTENLILLRNKAFKENKKELSLKFEKKAKYYHKRAENLVKNHPKVLSLKKNLKFIQ